MPPQEFQIVSDFKPMGDQPAAIDALCKGLDQKRQHQTLLGATGTGKTFTMANVIERTRRPALIISHNKTLAAQLYEEMRELFPNNAVSYFVSYYDYYQPEAYIPQRDIYIEKDASRNDDLDRLRLAATSNLLSRNDVIVVASVSCIFGLGSPTTYKDRVLALRVGQQIDRRDILGALADMQYARNDIEFKRSTFRARGDVIEVFPAYEQFAVRIELFGDDIDRLELIHPTSGEVLASETHAFIFPAVHYMLDGDRQQEAIRRIQEELDAQVLNLRSQGKLLEAQRLLARTKYDLEMLQEVGYCGGIENYSMHLDLRNTGEKPYSMLDYFEHVPGRNADDWLLFIDESHVTLPQIRAMYNGDRARKQVLVEHGFRLPSALDNRPLQFEEFETMVPNVVYVSATPSPYELQMCEGEIVEQVIRPTGLLDPDVEVRPATGQVNELLAEAKQCVERNERMLVTVLTKRLAEDLTAYLHDQGLRTRYLHSSIDTLERIEILRDLRLGEFDVLIGVNLLREGLDLPEVALVAIVDADKAGFLRSTTSLIQTIGRAARNVNARVILFGDKITPQMQAAIDETNRRRARQEAYNQEHNITPATIKKAIRRGIEQELKARQTARHAVHNVDNNDYFDREELIATLEREMVEAADALEFEKAASLRDQLKRIQAMPSIGGDDEQADKIKRSAVETPKPKPGEPRTRAGIASSGKGKNKKTGRSRR